MRLIDAQKRLKDLGQPVISSTDAAACLRLPRGHASKVMTRLAESGFVLQLTRRRWDIAGEADRLMIPEFLASPSTTYLSLQTALYHHGLILQIPETTYAVTSGKTRRYETPLGAFSLHHLDPDFFFGFDVIGEAGIKMATPEKALIDFLYLSPARSRLFAALPEVELPKSFSKRRALEMIGLIRAERRRSLVRNKFEDLLT